MADPDPQYEKKLLRDVVEQMKNPDEAAKKQRRLQRTIALLGNLGLLAAFVLALTGSLHAFASALLAGAAGCAIGFAIFLRLAHRQWPVTRKHIDMASVRTRLEELER